MKRFEYEVVAHCKPEDVWQVFADMDRWPEWNPVVGKSHWISGEPWKLGSRFYMLILQPRKISFRPTINEISAPNRVAWTGTSPGFKGTHWHEFIGRSDGTTVIRTWEEMSGLLTHFITAKMREKLMKMYADWLKALASEAEKIATSSASSASNKS